MFQQVQLLNTDSRVYGTGPKGVIDPKGRNGWYIKNNTTGKKAHWYFFDGVSQNENLGSFSAFAVVTVDSVSSLPFLALYSAPTGSGDAYPGFYKSSRVFVWSPSLFPPVVGRKYLIYFGQNPDIYNDLPRVQLTAGTTHGAFNSSERVLSVAFSTNSGASLNSMELVAERLGINTPNTKMDIELKVSRLVSAVGGTKIKLSGAIKMV